MVVDSVDGWSVVRLRGTADGARVVFEGAKVEAREGARVKFVGRGGWGGIGSTGRCVGIEDSDGNNDAAFVDVGRNDVALFEVACVVGCEEGNVPLESP